MAYQIIRLYFLKKMNMFKVKEPSLFKMSLLFLDFPVPECPSRIAAAGIANRWEQDIN